MARDRNTDSRRACRKIISAMRASFSSAFAPASLRALSDSLGRNRITKNEARHTFLNEAVERSILPSHGKLLVGWRAINLHIKFHNASVERQQRTQEPVEITPTDQFCVRPCCSHGASYRQSSEFHIRTGTDRITSPEWTGASAVSGAYRVLRMRSDVAFTKKRARRPRLRCGVLSLSACAVCAGVRVGRPANTPPGIVIVRRLSVCSDDTHIN